MLRTTLPTNLPAKRTRATPQEARRWPRAAATIREGDPQVITSPGSAPVPRALPLME
jgi:hypothetical protein